MADTVEGLTRLTFFAPGAGLSYTADVDAIVAAFRARGYEVSNNDARHAWEAYSESMAAGWMCVPEADTPDARGYITTAAMPYLIELDRA